MGLFGRKKAEVQTAVATKQPPDELGEKAQEAYGNQRFEEAMMLYAAAIDKLHTMYVAGNCSVRQPSPADAYIVDGFASAVGAAKAMGTNVHVVNEAQGAVHYLRQIADTSEMFGFMPGTVYRESAQAAEFELR